LAASTIALAIPSVGAQSREDPTLKEGAAILTPTMIKSGLAVKQAVQVGQGLNEWPSVHIDDTTDGFMILIRSILKQEKLSHGREGYYFLENGSCVALVQ
jgi:hypothetical protein